MLAHGDAIPDMTTQRRSVVGGAHREPTPDANDSRALRAVRPSSVFELICSILTPAARLVRRQDVSHDVRGREWQDCVHAQGASAERLTARSAAALTLHGAETVAQRQAHRLRAPRSLLAGRQVLQGAQIRRRLVARAHDLAAQERITCKKRFNLLPTQQPALVL